MKSISDWFSRLNNNSPPQQAQTMTAVTPTTVVAGCVVALTLIVGHTAPAADWSSIALNRAVIQADKQAIVAKLMDLNKSTGEGRSGCPSTC